MKMPFVLCSPFEPRCAVKMGGNGKLQIAGWAAKALRVLGDKCLAGGLVETAIERRRQWAEPEAFVVVGELVSTRSASVSVAEHRKSIELLAACLAFVHTGREETPNDPSSATRPTRAHDCNRDAMAGFAAAHG